LLRWIYSSPVVILSSVINRSILLMTSKGLSFSVHVCLRTVTVWLHTPSTASTSTTAPSQSRDAVETSLLKSIWPGESIRLIRYSLASGAASGLALRIMEKKSEIAEDSMVMPRLCSSGRESRYRIFPASFGEMMPFVLRRQSVSDVLPWSTCAKMHI
jgi:hypothetical protein